MASFQVKTFVSSAYEYHPIYYQGFLGMAPCLEGLQKEYSFMHQITEYIKTQRRDGESEGSKSTHEQLSLSWEVKQEQEYDEFALAGERRGYIIINEELDLE